jgi:hypothetical protein
MVIKMKRRSSLDISVAESEAKLDPSACHWLVGGVATSALMKLIPAPISDANSKDSLVFLTKILVQKQAKLCRSKESVHKQNHIHPHTQTCKVFITIHVEQREAHLSDGQSTQEKRNRGDQQRATKHENRMGWANGRPAEGQWDA